MAELDDEEQTAVETINAIQPAGGEACLVNVSGSDICRRWKLTQDRFSIGRSPECDISVDETGVSRFHAEVLRTPFAMVIADLDSTNGTLVNGQRVKRRRLSDGDQIRVGKAVFKYLESNNLESAYYDEVFRLTTLDDLTQIHNRRYFFVELERELARAMRHKRDLAMILFDIDHFKDFNDTHGHQAGDVVLNGVAQRVQDLCRQEDVLARYGGEEFIMLLPEVGLEQCSKLAERIRAAVAGEPFTYEEQQMHVTISLGVSDVHELMMIPSHDNDVKVRMSQFVRLVDNNRVVH